MNGDTKGIPPLELSRFRAILFDLDGVITKTAVVHAAAWKWLFDEFLQQHHAGDSAVRLFDVDEDYRLYVDGKPRYDGVRSFLESRAIRLPMGSRDDDPDKKTVYGLGNKKDRYFDRALQETGVEIYPSTVECARVAKARGMKLAVVSSSHHCKEVLDAVGLADLFEVRVDGVEVDRLKLQGKPAPDTFLEAARRLQVQPPEAIVVEDAQAGVAAGHAGGFGLVVAVDRHGEGEALREQGAHLVVPDLDVLLPLMTRGTGT